MRNRLALALAFCAMLVVPSVAKGPIQARSEHSPSYPKWKAFLGDLSVFGKQR
jgi:hypothetical protein